MSTQSSNHSEEPAAPNPMDREEHKESSKEQTAVAALASLVGINSDVGQSFAASEAEDDGTEHDDEEETAAGGNAFLIPQRFTKSGRHRAVPFPLKVSIRSHSLQLRFPFAVVIGT